MDQQSVDALLTSMLGTGHDAFAANLAAEETVMTYCTNKIRMRRELDQAKKRQGQVAQDIPSGLKLHIPEPVVLIDEKGEVAPA